MNDESPPLGPTAARRAAQAESTRASLVAAARKLFVNKGFDATSTEEIVAAAEVGTRGALYHHFADKRALFEAVVLDIEQELLATMAAEFAAADSIAALDLLRREIHAFLDACLGRDVQRILLIDGRAVLGWQRWREIESRHGITAMRSLLDRAVAEHAMAPDAPTDAIAHMLLAALDEATLYIAAADGTADAHDNALRAMNTILDGLERR
ncbi:TetR/AcrR family transcriptional regulator [Nocardia vaccinii]|uniref:TetR/AcrR family transcriptional regulator n=1 Tax=Nocardia vaccinii TaxID=1822 RepID=UPI00082CA13A|nr:TetR/AcrR family transcriptional regulator [Nocardia vaccinii]